MGTFSENVPITPHTWEGPVNSSQSRTASLSIRSAGKSYGPTIALSEVSLDLRPGEVHALLGENGAGKSTLVKILTGVVRPDVGSMTLEGAPYAPHSIMEARRLGVSTAFQELSLLPNLTVAENLMQPSMPRNAAGLTSRRLAEKQALAILNAHDLAGIDAGALVSSLPLSDRQRIEIVRAMVHATKLLVLDEPTAALVDVEWLFRLVRSIQARGTAVLYISHRLGEVRALCSRATVLRNGSSIATVDLDGATDADIFKMMVGRASDYVRSRAPASAVSTGERLTVEGLTSGMLRDASFSLRPGEIVGVAALEGQGQRDLFRSIVGLAPMATGSVRVDGQATRMGSPRDALRAASGIAYLPEERKTEGILASLTTASNMAIPVLGSISRFGVVSPSAEQRAVTASAASVELAERYLPFRISDLSGGNQQKAILARVINTGAKTLLLFDPTRGVDVGTKQSIYAAIRRFAADGGSILFYSSELPEIVNLAHRCLVLYGGSIRAEYAGDAINEETLVGALIGHGTATRPFAESHA
jgi:ribose transport system ATP-binding protein